MSERRVTSIVFGDLVGFTTLAEGRDAEEVRELLSRYFTEARVVVERYGGTVEKFIGDAVMAVWGVPVAHEDDAERAVRAGLELVETIAVLGSEVGLPALAMRVGVVTGEVAVTVGATGQGMVAGDAVNTASRVQAEAAPGRVWVDERTRNLAATSVSFRSVGNHVLKGKADPVALWEAGTVVASMGGVDRVDGLDSPMVGRDRELRLVKELFHGTEDAVRPTVLVLEGEAGVGKSRVAWEFEKYVDGLHATVRWHRGRCLSYGDGVAFWALSEAVRVRLGLVDADMGPVSTARLEEALLPWVPDDAEREWLRPRVGVLVGVEPVDPISREELFSAWVTFFERVAGEKSLVLLVDDAQYADEALLDFLEHLLAVSRSAIFVLLLARTGLVEHRPSLATRRRSTVLHLEPLPDADMASLLDGLVDGLPAAVRAQLVARSEGIPLFAVETVRALIDRDVVVPSEGRYVLAEPDAQIVAELAAPASLQALVAARLDALTPQERRVVGDASVLGLSFTADGIAALDEHGDDLAGVLDSLVSKQILSLQTDRFSAEYGQYRFVQAVVRQVAYEMLARRDRKARHLAVVAHLESSPEAGDDIVGVLAQHYLDALDASADVDEDVDELMTKATELLERAAARSRSLGAHGEAHRYAERALARVDDRAHRARLLERSAQALVDNGYSQDALSRIEEATDCYLAVGDEAGRIRVAGILASALIDLGRNAEIIEQLRPLWDSVTERPDTIRPLLDIGRGLSAAYLGLGERDAATATLERRVRLAEGLGDPGYLADIVGAMGVAYWTRGAPFVGTVLLRASAELGRAHGNQLIVARALSNLAAVHLPDDVDVATEYGTGAVESATRSGVMSYIGVAASNLALALWTAGRWRELQEHLDRHPYDEVRNVSDRLLLGTVARWFARAADGPAAPEVEFDDEFDDGALIAWWENNRLHVFQQAGDLAAAAAAGEASVRNAVFVSGLSDDFMHLWPQAVLAALDAGEVETARRLVDVVTESPDGLVSVAVRAQLHRLDALVGAAEGRAVVEVEAGLRRAIDALEEYGARPERARTQEQLGRWLQGHDRDAEAAELLAAARVTYSELGALGWLRALGAGAGHDGSSEATPAKISHR